MEDFVTFEIAKKLKEKGFKDNCIGYYDYAEEFHYNYESAISNKEMYFCHNKYDNIWHRDLVDTPIIAQVLKWLRKEKQIYVSVEVEHEKWFEYKIVNLVKNTRMNSTRVYETYEEAIITGIKYVLDNLI